MDIIIGSRAEPRVGDMVVANGFTVATQPDGLCHGVLTVHENVIVAIQDYLYPNWALPFPTMDAATIGEAIKSVVKWGRASLQVVRGGMESDPRPSTKCGSANSKRLESIDVRRGFEDVGKIEDVAGLAARIVAVRFVLPTAEQARWDVKDVQTHALIVLPVKRAITLHICSAKFAKQAWDILAGLYAGRNNEAKIALLRKELESKIMNEEDDIDTFLVGDKDINEQLIFACEVISDSSLVQTVLDVLPDSYQTFASTWRLMSQRNPEVVKFDEPALADRALKMLYPS
ncbi:hypothetical protein L7F22_008817 [Adiantum nelumboides]|nr:hypothetical protein [Adiantum nelumboides]